MKITQVKINLVSGEPLKAFASITLESCFVIHDLRIIKTQDKMFVAMPSKKLPDGEHKDIVHPINQETRKQIEQVVLEAYQKTIREI